MPYDERSTSIPGVVMWRSIATGPAPRRILPDGCLDLIWDGERLFVAGPDSTARWHRSQAGARHTALRFSSGMGPALLGVPADELRDRMVDVEDLCPAAEARTLTERVAADPVGSLEGWAAARHASRRVDALGRLVFAMAGEGVAVARMADELGLSARQLQRRCLPLFGYGPRRLGRVLRLGRALDAVRAGGSLAAVAADCGYADQGHLAREVRALTGAAPTQLFASEGVDRMSPLMSETSKTPARVGA